MIVETNKALEMTLTNIGATTDTLTWVIVKVAFGSMTLVSCYHYVRRTWFGEREDTEKLYAHMMRRNQVLSSEHRAKANPVRGRK